MRIVRAILMATLVAAASNPSSFTCDLHNQTFIKQGTISQNGRCYDVYAHALPAHRVLLPCSTD